MGANVAPRSTATKLDRIAWLSAKDENKTFNSMMHHVKVESLRECYTLLDGKKAVGIDGVFLITTASERYCREPIALIGHDEVLTRGRGTTEREEPVYSLCATQAPCY